MYKISLIFDKNFDWHNVTQNFNSFSLKSVRIYLKICENRFNSFSRGFASLTSERVRSLWKINRV